MENKIKKFKKYMDELNSTYSKKRKWKKYQWQTHKRLSKEEKVKLLEIGKDIARFFGDLSENPAYNYFNDEIERNK